MKKAVYNISVLLSQTLGSWIFQTIARFIATGYFILFPDRVANSLRFYRALFPEKGRIYHLWCTWMQYQNFTRVFLDRSIFLNSGKFSYTSQGWSLLQQAQQDKTGGIILMSHVGNWEVAAHLLKKRQENLKLLLFLGTKHKEQIEKMQKDSLENSGTKIIAVDKTGGSPFLLIEAIKWMNDGGLVSLTGDIVWTEDQKVVTVDFLGKKADLPETPFMLALISGKPLFIMFSVPGGKNHLQIKAGQPMFVKADNRKNRKSAVQKAAQQYADRLAEVVHKHPFEWYHFDNFLK